MKVKTITGKKGAPKGKTAMPFSRGQVYTVQKTQFEGGEWYATSTGSSILWFPLSSTVPVYGETEVRKVPWPGMQVEFISDKQGAPTGKSSMMLREDQKGQVYTIHETQFEGGEWYATSTKSSTLWFPLSSTIPLNQTNELTPKPGMKVKTISDKRGAPSGSSALVFAKGEVYTVGETQFEDGEWYVTSTARSTLWFPLSSTILLSGETEVPRTGMKVKTISDKKGAPSGNTEMPFSRGEVHTIRETQFESGEWYAMSLEWRPLWFPLSSTIPLNGETKESRDSGSRDSGPAATLSPAAAKIAEAPTVRKVNKSVKILPIALPMLL